MVDYYKTLACIISRNLNNSHFIFQISCIYFHITTRTFKSFPLYIPLPLLFSTEESMIPYSKNKHSRIHLLPQSGLRVSRSCVISATFYLLKFYALGS